MSKPYVVVVEDCPDETFLYKRIIDQYEQEIELETLENGAQAIEMLNAPDAKLPDLVILDNRIPYYSGIEVIQSLMSNERFHTVPMVLISNYFSKSDIQEAYRVGARSCVGKGKDVADWNRQLRSVLAYWLTINEVLSSNY